MQSDYLTVAETAKLLRSALKREFPSQKFSVRSESYSMGASITVRWQGGPAKAEVYALTDRWQGAAFDGMCDMEVDREHWLLPDGTVTLASCPGTESQRGQIKKEEHPAPGPAARRVRLGADYIECVRAEAARAEEGA